MVNVDLKLALKSLALSLEKVLLHVIHEDQYAYVKGRSIFDAIWSIDNIMNFTKMKQLPGLMVAIDFEKAFDCISLQFLLNPFKSFNFCELLIKWVSVLLDHFLLCY